MGNYISCKILTCTSPQTMTTSSKTSIVILPNGKTKQIHQRIKAAELMMEAPNFFIVNAKSLKIGHRFLPLVADDDLETYSNVYAMFPMRRKNSVVTNEDLGALFLTANSIVERASINVKGSTVFRVLPESRNGEEVSPDIEGSNEVEVPRSSLEGFEEVSTPELKHRMSMLRSRKPLLETISEEQYCY